MSREQLADAILDEKMPKVCDKHRQLVYHDEPECPCCRMGREVRIGNRATRREKELARKQLRLIQK